MDLHIFVNHRFKAYNQNHWAAMAQEVECHRVSVKVSLSKTEPPIDPSLPLTKREEQEGSIAPDEQVCALHGFLLHRSV